MVVAGAEAVKRDTGLGSDRPWSFWRRIDHRELIKNCFRSSHSLYFLTIVIPVGATIPATPNSTRVTQKLVPIPNSTLSLFSTSDWISCACSAYKDSKSYSIRLHNIINHGFLLHSAIRLSHRSSRRTPRQHRTPHDRRNQNLQHRIK